MNKILFFLLLLVSIAYGQKRDEIFRETVANYGTTGYSYQVSVLKLHENQEYTLLLQKYISKRFARKNIPYQFLEEKGTWTVNADTLKLVDTDSRRELMFIKKKNHLMYLFHDVYKSGYWNKVSH